MIHIDHLNLRLPAGFEDRAHGIAQLIASELALLPVSRDVQLRHLSLADIHVSPHASDKQVAGTIAAHIQSRLHAPSGGKVGR